MGLQTDGRKRIHGSSVHPTCPKSTQPMRTWMQSSSLFWMVSSAWPMHSSNLSLRGFAPSPPYAQLARASRGSSERDEDSSCRPSSGLIASASAARAPGQDVLSLAASSVVVGRSTVEPRQPRRPAGRASVGPRARPGLRNSISLYRPPRRCGLRLADGLLAVPAASGCDAPRSTSTSIAASRRMGAPTTPPLPQPGCHL